LHSAVSINADKVVNVAVSALKILFPSETGIPPAFSISAISLSSNPPSGPINTAIFSPRSILDKIDAIKDNYKQLNVHKKQEKQMFDKLYSDITKKINEIK